MPVVDGLEREFGDRIDFFHLNIDVRDEMSLAQEYEIYRRSQYVLLDAEGNVVRVWFGLLDEVYVSQEIEVALAKLE